MPLLILSMLPLVRVMKKLYIPMVICISKMPSFIWTIPLTIRNGRKKRLKTDSAELSEII